MKRWLLIIAASIFMAGIFSLQDFAWPQSPCPELFEIVHHEQDRDGNEFWQIVVTEFMQENGTDSMCLAFGRCIYDLIASADGMGAVEIMNPEGEWVPSQWRWIESTRATILAGLDEDEDGIEYAIGYSRYLEE